MTAPEGRTAAEVVESGIGRRDLLRAAAVIGAGAGVAATPVVAEAAPASRRTAEQLDILQPGTGRITGDHYLSPKPDEVLWGYVPAIGATPVLELRSGQTVTIDTLSHGGHPRRPGPRPGRVLPTPGRRSQ